MMVSLFRTLSVFSVYILFSLDTVNLIDRHHAFSARPYTHSLTHSDQQFDNSPPLIFSGNAQLHPHSTSYNTGSNRCHLHPYLFSQAALDDEEFGDAESPEDFPVEVEPVKAVTASVVAKAISTPVVAAASFDVKTSEIKAVPVVAKSSPGTVAAVIPAIVTRPFAITAAVTPAATTEKLVTITAGAPAHAVKGERGNALFSRSIPTNFKMLKFFKLRYFC